jgi:GNAT superfamily N-acetyltransferase
MVLLINIKYGKAEKAYEMIYNVHPDMPIDVNELALFLEHVDNCFPEPLGIRSYFTTYINIASKFLKSGMISYATDNDGVLAGVAVAYIDKNKYRRAYETYMAVAPEYLRRGIASHLMHMEIDMCRRSGIGGIMTNCHPTNIAKKALNIKLGFREVTIAEEIDEMVSINPKWKGKSFYVLDW